MFQGVSLVVAVITEVKTAAFRIKAVKARRSGIYAQAALVADIARRNIR